MGEQRKEEVCSRRVQGCPSICQGIALVYQEKMQTTYFLPLQSVQVLHEYVLNIVLVKYMKVMVNCGVTLSKKPLTDSFWVCLDD